LAFLEDANVSREWHRISKDARNLVAALMNALPSKRISAEAALNSPWIKGDLGQAGRRGFTDDWRDALRATKASRRVRRLAMRVVDGSTLSDQQLDLFSQALAASSQSNASRRDGANNLVSLNDIAQSFLAAGLEEVPIECQMLLSLNESEADLRQIDQSELIASPGSDFRQDLCWAAFRVFDRPLGNKITQTDMLTMLGGSSDTASKLDNGIFPECNTIARLMPPESQERNNIVDMHLADQDPGIELQLFLNISEQSPLHMHYSNQRSGGRMFGDD
jgi:hypothetical protein